jgi:hypothetical protein
MPMNHCIHPENDYDDQGCQIFNRKKRKTHNK